MAQILFISNCRHATLERIKAITAPPQHAAVTVSTASAAQETVQTSLDPRVVNATNEDDILYVLLMSFMTTLSLL